MVPDKSNDSCDGEKWQFPDDRQSPGKNNHAAKRKHVDPSTLGLGVKKKTAKLSKVKVKGDININRFLPNTCLMQILGLLNFSQQLSCMKVCQYWEELIRHNLVVRKQIIVPRNKRCGRRRNSVNMTCLIDLLPLCPALTCLDMMGVEHFDGAKFISTVTQSCKQLKELVLPHGCVLSEDDSLKLANGFTQLNNLVAHQCNLTDKFLYTLFTSCKDLSKLRISKNEKITSKPFLITPVKLKELNIVGCFAVSVVDVVNIVSARCKESLVSLIMSVYLSRSLTAAKLHEFTNLKRLVLIGNRACGPITAERSTDLSNVAKLHNLQCLYLHNCLISDQHLSAIIDGCLQLNELYITCSVASLCLSTSMGLLKLRDGKNLEVLNLSGQSKLSDECLQGLSTLPNLRHLHILHCEGISNAGVKFLIESPSLVTIGVPRQIDDADILKQFESRLEGWSKSMGGGVYSEWN